MLVETTLPLESVTVVVTDPFALEVTLVVSAVLALLPDAEPEPEVVLAAFEVLVELSDERAVLPPPTPAMLMDCSLKRPDAS